MKPHTLANLPHLAPKSESLDSTFTSSIHYLILTVLLSVFYLHQKYVNLTIIQTCGGDSYLKGIFNATYFSTN